MDPVTSFDHAKRQLQPYLLDAVCQWIPLLFSFGIVVLLTFIHVTAYYQNHLTVEHDINGHPERLIFPVPPISLTANVTPMYWFYSFGCVTFAFLASYYVRGCKKALWQFVTCVSDVVPTESGDTSPQSRAEQPSSPLAESPPHPDTPSNQENVLGGYQKHERLVSLQNAGGQDQRLGDGTKPYHSTPPNRRIAFWRYHFRRDAALADEARIRSVDASPRSERPRPGRRSVPPLLAAFQARHRRQTVLLKKPLLRLANITLHLALIGFGLQAVVPARKDALKQLTARCMRIKDIYKLNSGDEVSLSKGASAEQLGSSRNLVEENFAFPRIPVIRQTKPMSDYTLSESVVAPLPPQRRLSEGEFENTHLDDSRNPLADTPQEDREPSLLGGVYGADSNSWDGRWLQGGILRSYLVVDPFEPRPSPLELSVGKNLIFCDAIELRIRDVWTLIHAIAAMVFFFCAYTTMSLFCIWLIARWTSRPCRAPSESWVLAPSITSIILKVVLTVLPLLRPVNFIKRDILRHVSLVDWYGLSQRFSVACILLYTATVGIEIRAIRKALLRVEKSVSEVVSPT